MSKQGGRPGALRISGGGGGAKVELDGEDISEALTGVSLCLDVDHMPTVTLDIMLWDVSADTEDTRIVVPDGTRDLLVALGWTPPKEETP